MEIRMRYKTRQLKELCDFLEETSGRHFTVGDVMAYFKEMQIPIAKTTIYRRLENLVETGIIKKYFIDEESSTCYEFLGKPAVRKDQYHMKCESCGKLYHLECEEIGALEAHIYEHHKFKVDPMRTVFYGICEECSAK